MTRLCTLLPVLVCFAGQCLADSPALRVSITDGDPHDRIRLTNIGDCTIITGSLAVDFSNSVGKIIIDTQYGGVGTKDPMPVDVEIGPISVAPVSDGDTQITINIDGMIPHTQAVVTLDLDNNASGWFARRVSILSDDLEGTTLAFGGMTSVFGANSTLDIPLPATVCSEAEIPPVTIPIS